jgi:hypothetical protein
VEAILLTAGIVAATTCVGLSIHGFGTGHSGRGAAWLVAAPVAFFVGAIAFGVLLFFGVIAAILWVMDQS